MENLIVEFLKVFLDVLERKSHDLLKEEIVFAVYNMASVSFEAFFNRFLSEYLEKTEGIDSNQKAILKSAFKTDTVSKTRTIMCQILPINFYETDQNKFFDANVSTSVTRFGDLLYFGQLFKAWATIILPKLPTHFRQFLSKGVKIFHFTREILYGQLL